MVVAVAGEEIPDVLRACEDAAVPVVAVVDELRPWSLRDLHLRYSCIRTLITQDDVEAFDFGRLRQEVMQSAQPGCGVAIGSTWSLPAEPEPYEARRFLSFDSKSTAPFLSELRAALGQMRRVRPEIPWDPADRLAAAAVDSKGLLKTSGPFNLSDLVEHAREESVRQIFSGTGELGEWKSLPPPLLILGDSGTGKSLLAGLIHDVLTDAPTHDGRRGQLVEVAVAGMDIRNFDYELFGATTGTYSGVSFRVGAATQAAYGTLFLDELGDMPHDAQTRLLRYFNDLRIRIEGTSQSFFPYTHIVAATNREVSHMVALGQFRNDLLARFRARVTLPPLRAREPGELTRLIDFVAQNPLVNPDHPHDHERLVSHISPDAMARLLGHEYRDGNFRELEYVIHTAIWRARGANRRTIEAEDIDLAKPRHRTDRNSRIVPVKALPLCEHNVEVEELDELLRLAERRDLVVLRCGLDYALFTDGLAFRSRQ
ncbi:sigma 54-interacting transcriptional regulator [Mycobacterium sp. ZZG]